MRIGVVSDTHRNKEFLDTVADWLVNKQHCVKIFHLGDDLEDVADLAGMGIDVLQVPGIYHPKYRDGSIKPKAWDEAMGLRILLVHSIDKDASDEDIATADVILHGHTHHPELELSSGHLLMNPGHLKGPKDKNVEPSFGMLDISDKGVVATIFDLAYNEVESLECFKAENGLYRA